jgi:hypothetical protein
MLIKRALLFGLFRGVQFKLVQHTLHLASSVSKPTIKAIFFACRTARPVNLGFFQEF